MNGDSPFERARDAVAAGDRATAGRLCAAILATEPGHAGASNLLGVLANQDGRPEEALAHFARACADAPDNALAWFNRGGTLRRLGRIDEALAALARAQALSPAAPEISTEQGLTQMAAGAFAVAAQSFAAALTLAPDDAAALTWRAVALHLAGNMGAALDAFGEAVARVPGDPELAFRFGLAWQDADRQDRAADEFSRAIRLAPGLAKAHVYLGIALNNLGRSADALASFHEGLRLDPADARPHWYEGKSLHRLGRDREAVEAYSRSIARDATNADAFVDRGYSHFCLGEYAAARHDYEEALRLDPAKAPAHVNLALLLLLEGDLARGWAEYEWRWRLDEALAAPRTFNVPRWSGGAFAKCERILLHGEQGLGDTIQFCRFAAAVAARGTHVVLETDPALAELMRAAPGVAQVVVSGETSPPVDRHSPLMSLPHVLGIGLADIPAPRRYLKAPASRLEEWRARLGPADGLRVGIAWRGNPRHLRDAWRSLPAAALAGLLGAQAQFVSLQKDVPPEDEAVIAALPGLLRFDASIRDLSDVAALCELVDMVVAVDTGVAHLAGALGRPLRVLLPFVPDWRWLLGREDSPWYPTARLVRQPAPGDWASVVTRVRAEIDNPAHWRAEGDLP